MATDTIARLPALIAALPPGQRALLERLFQVVAVEGALVAPDEMHPWLADPFGSVEAIERQLVLRVMNRWTFEGSTFNPVRARRPNSGASQRDPGALPTEVIRAIRQDKLRGDDFCQREQKTTRDIFGRPLAWQSYNLPGRRHLPMKQRLGKHAIGRWCKLGAWVIALLGVVQVVGILISRSAAQPFLAPGSGPLQPYYFVMLFLQPILSVATYTVFYVLVLYAIGIACDHFFGRAKSPMSEPIPEDDDVLEEAIPPD